MMFPKKKWSKGVKKTSNEAIFDVLFSKYIRLRDADEFGMCKCITCGTRKKWNEMDQGHFQTRKHLSVKYHEKNSNAQCRKCNSFEGGRQYEHGIAIDKKYGAGTAEMLILLSKVTGNKHDDLWYQEMIKIFRPKVKALLKNI
jgi:hypothetical protein